MHEIVRTRIRYCYRRLHIMLRRQNWDLGRHLVFRLYREEGLILRTKRPRRCKMVVHYEARIDFSRPGKPTDNALIQIFNETLRDECLNIHWFGSINKAKIPVGSLEGRL